MLTAERLRELLDYDPLTGVFLWRVTRGRAVAGAVAGHMETGDRTRGYWVIMIDRKLYRAHRLAWFYVHGAWPQDEIDHRNLVRQDNRMANLRQATRSQNRANYRLRPQNSGMKGITYRRKTGKWQAQIQVEGKKINIGSFLKPEEAHAAYRSAALHHFGEFARFE
jgi:hypothetical protein